LRALLLIETRRPTEASISAQRAMDIDANDAYVQHAAGEVALALLEPAAAISAAQRARALEPDNDAFVFLEGRARALLGQWDEVRARMDYILAGNPEHEGAAMLRAFALEAKGGMKGPMGAADWAALAERFPHNSFMRTGHAWQLLEQGAREAEQQFEQALTVEPNSEWAKQGLVLALKTRYPGYGVLLRYFFWLNTLAPRTQMMLAIGGVIGINMLRGYARTNPEARPFVMPIVIAYAVFIFSTWLADPLLNLVLMRHPEGRRVLSDDDRRSGTAVGACLGAALVLALLSAFTPWKSAGLSAIAVGFTSLTLAGAYKCAPGRYRDRLLRASALFLSCGVLVMMLPEPLSGLLFGAAILGVVICTWLARSWVDRSWAEQRHRA
jgi:tetratricopeptide (TPR) repeat protein